MSETPRIPVETIDPGTMLVVGSDDLDRAQTLSTFLLSMGCNPDDGILFVSTDTPAEDLLTRCAGFDLDPESMEMRLINGTGTDAEPPSGLAVEEVPEADLTGLGITFSVVYENLSAARCQRILAGVHTLSTVLKENDLRTVVRFLNTVSKRIESGGGLIVFVIDSDAHDQASLTTLSQVCDGYIEVRGTDTTDNEIRIHGLPDQPDGWVTVPESLLDPGE